MDALETYRHWFQYECDVHEKVLESLQSVPSAGRASAEFAKAVSLFGHMVAARRIWLARLDASYAMPESLFPTGATLDEAAAGWRQAAQWWTEYLGSRSLADLDRVFEYRSLDGARFRNRVGDILTQLFGHSWYHRGQIATLVRQAGGQPAITDFVYWCREPIVEPAPPT